MTAWLLPALAGGALVGVCWLVHWLWLSFAHSDDLDELLHRHRHTRLQVLYHGLTVFDVDLGHLEALQKMAPEDELLQERLMPNILLRLVPGR